LGCAKAQVIRTPRSFLSSPVNSSVRGIPLSESKKMKSIHVIPEIPLVVIYDRVERRAEMFEVSLQELFDLKKTLRDALSRAFPSGFPSEGPPLS